MAFIKYAQAVVTRPSVSMVKQKGSWDKVRKKARGRKKGFDKTASNLLAEYPPDKYLLTHCTIMASVDIEKVPGAKTGSKVAFGGETINRKWDDYYITKETEQFINSNYDAWDRQTLLNTYHTFIGAENYCFVPDTKVLMSDGTYKEIRDVRVGDKVITHKGRVRSVVHKFERDYEGEVNEIYVDRHEKPIVATPNHPFFCEEKSTDIFAGEEERVKRREAGGLVRGEILVGPENLGDGQQKRYTITEKKTRSYKGKVYNIEVEEDHSYVVDYGVAVQNCEHVQIKELSKGKIIDAVARDLGETVYIDILVATDRKHKQLIKDIESGKVNSMSMGCSISYSRCTKCGNVAAEEEDLCEHVKHQKGDYFIDAQGEKRRVAELCGHHTDPASVTFIEASWVANPAFKGAVLRQVLNGSKGFSEEARRATALMMQEKVASSPLLAEFLESQNRDEYATASLKQRVASALVKYAFGFGGDGDDDDDEDEAEPFTKVKDDIKKKLRDDIKKELQQELEEDLGFIPEEPMFTGPDNKEDVNENIITAYKAFSARYAHKLGTRTRPVFQALYATSFYGSTKVAGLKGVTRADRVAALYIRDKDIQKKAMPQDLYMCLLDVKQNSDNDRKYIKACQQYIRRELKQEEASWLLKQSREIG